MPDIVEVKVKFVLKPTSPPNRTFFPCNMKRLGVLLPPPGWDASPSQGYPPAFHHASLTIRQYPYLLLGGERHCDSSVSRYFKCIKITQTIGKETCINQLK